MGRSIVEAVAEAKLSRSIDRIGGIEKVGIQIYCYDLVYVPE